MEEYKKGLLEERKQLKKRIEKLYRFLSIPVEMRKTTIVQIELMNVQLAIMRSYLTVLDTRINDLGLI